SLMLTTRWLHQVYDILYIRYCAYDQMVSMGYSIIVYTMRRLRPNGLNGLYDCCVYDACFDQWPQWGIQLLCIRCGAYDQMVSMGYTIIVYTMRVSANGLNGVYDFCVYDAVLTTKWSQSGTQLRTR